MLKNFFRGITHQISQAIRNPLVRNMLIVGTSIFGIKILAFIKETVIASNFGLSITLDTYYLAILIPSITQNVFIGALKSLFIPNYVVESKTTQKIGEFQSYVFLAITVIVLAFSLIAVVFVSFGLETVFPDHDLDYYNSIRTQFYIVLPCLIFWGYSGFFGGLLEINNKYFSSTITGIFSPLVMIAFIVFFKSQLGDLVLAIGFMTGSMVSFAFLLIETIRFKFIRFSKPRINENIRNMIKQYPPKVTSGILTGINPFVDQFFAAQLVAGSISALQYGTKIPMFMVGIIMIAVGNVMLPHFAVKITEDKLNAYRQLFKILKKVFIAASIITAMAVILSTEVIRLIFEKGAFTSENTEIVSLIQRIALVYIPFYLCTLLCVKFLTANNQNRFMAWVSLLNLILNLVFNFIFVKYFGVYGLILSTTLVYIIASFIYVGYNIIQYKNLIKVDLH